MSANKKAKILTKEEVVKLILTRQGEMNTSEYARELEVSPSYISDIYRGTREPGEKMLKQLGQLGIKIRKTRRVVVEYQLEG